jgi:hypothetical protein
MAAAHGGVVLRQHLFLRCEALFLLCEHCDRGHRYCSLACRNTATPTAGINKAPKAGWIVATVSANIASVACKPA